MNKDTIKQALEAILNYPELREYVGTELYDAALAALEAEQPAGGVKPCKCESYSKDGWDHHTSCPCWKPYIAAPSASAAVQPQAEQARLPLKATPEMVEAGILAGHGHSAPEQVRKFYELVIEGALAAAPVQPQEQPQHFGEVRETGVVWFNQNPHAYPVGTKFYAAPVTVQPASKPDEPMIDFINSPDLYAALMDVQNGIDSPASASRANRLICALDKLTRCATSSKEARQEEIMAAIRDARKEWEADLAVCERLAALDAHEATVGSKEASDKLNRLVDETIAAGNPRVDGWDEMPDVGREASDAAQEQRVGVHVLDFAKRLGWPNDGEGAFEYIQRKSYAQGLEDAAQAAQPVDRNCEEWAKQCRSEAGKLDENNQLRIFLQNCSVAFKYMGKSLALYAAPAQPVQEPAPAIHFTWSWYDDKTGTLSASGIKPPFAGMQEGDEVALYLAAPTQPCRDDGTTNDLIKELEAAVGKAHPFMTAHIGKDVLTDCIRALRTQPAQQTEPSVPAQAVTLTDAEIFAGIADAQVNRHFGDEYTFDLPELIKCIRRLLSGSAKTQGDAT